MEIWCQRRDSNSQTPVSKTGRYSNSRTLALWCTGEDLNLRVPQRGNRVTAGPFQPGSRTCASLAEGRRIERPWLITMPWFSGPVAGHSAVPSTMAESAGVEPASLLRKPLFIAFLQIVCPLDWKRKHKVPPGLRFADTPRNDDAVDTLFLKLI